jgi:hypothetical protein
MLPRGSGMDEEAIVRNAWRGCGIDLDGFIKEKQLDDCYVLFE